MKSTTKPNLIRLLVVYADTTTICSTAVWNLNATTVAGSSQGTSGSTPALLSQPYDVFVDGNGTIYVTDTLNSRIHKWLPGASTGITVAGGSSGTGLNQFNNREYYCLGHT